MREYVAFDLETTGLSPEQDQIIEIGAVKIRDSRIIGKYNCILHPEVPVSDFIINLTGISREMLKHGIPLKDGVDTLTAARKLLRGLPNKKLETLCAHYDYINQAAHRAYDDALATAVVFEQMKKEFPEERDAFLPRQLQYRVRKERPITEKQKRYLKELMKYHTIKDNVNVDMMTQSEASKKIDSIILNYGVMKK